MDFDFAAEQPKLVQLLIGVAAFLVVVAVILLLVDRAPMRRRAWTHATILLLPAVALLSIGLVVPAVRTTLLSFMSGDGMRWVGLDNYAWMFTQPEALTVLRNTLIWVLLVPLLVTSVGLLYAVMVDRTRFESLAKSLVFLPMAISFVGAGIIWRFVYAYRADDQDQIGLLNQLVVAMGGEPQQWLQESPTNTLFLIVVMVWIQAGFATVVLSAAIKGIPAEIVEAARLDGASPAQMFFRVTLPSIRSAVVVVAVTQSIATLKLFDIVRTMTGGQFDTSVIANEMYNQAFRYGETGKGAALAVFLFALVTPIVIYQIRQRREVR
ncbi:sugar ABC transporter permease [Streptosporangium sp. NBC_01639]|uniref:carbohydrate ABC transporter permease n=1 Tax=unclassified Streptosporangium TaxID=2632669 RepID=UPI002DDB6718|nr:sugar ABC transporter permease [Streptosporangium sp. NBC_01756]WSC88090.1 sugar ABC transporter permease [Streptosporangium sp. NBC_01756]WTD53234.1 sugar ABC transporter permease [Streptosporangium sp. NBC_01639]